MENKMKIFCNRRAQNFLEYTMLIMVIAAALIAMQQYIQRSANARLKQVQQELDESRR
jgi:Flp pilus assembly pilin Flp